MPKSLENDLLEAIRAADFCEGCPWAKEELDNARAYQKSIALNNDQPTIVSITALHGWEADLELTIDDIAEMAELNTRRVCLGPQPFDFGDEVRDVLSSAENSSLVTQGTRCELRLSHEKLVGEKVVELLGKGDEDHV